MFKLQQQQPIIGVSHFISILCFSSSSLFVSKPKAELEYLAVYGRASMAAFRQLSTHGQKFDPESLYEPI